MRLEMEDPNKKPMPDAADELTPPKDEKRSFKSEIAKMKGMSKKEAWSYFWEYYRVPVIVILVVIAAVVSIASSVIKNSRPYIISVSLYNNYLGEDTKEAEFQSEFADYVGLNLKDYQMSVNLGTMFDATATSEESYTTMMKIIAQISAKTEDMMGGDLSFMNYYGTGEPDNVFFADLQSVLPEELFQRLEDEGRVLYLTDSEGTRYAAGFDVSNTKMSEDCGLLVTPAYLGIVINAPHVEHCIAYIEFILGEK